MFIIVILIIMHSKPNIINKIRHLVTRTGNKIPQIALGTFQLAADEATSITKDALKKGYTYIDTAQYYDNEREIAQAIKASGLQRKNIFLSGKLNFQQFGQRAAKQGLQTILNNLQTDYLDILMIHWPGIVGLSPISPQNAKLRLQTWKTLIDLKNKGLVKDIGVANFLPRHLEHLKENSSELPVLNQIQLNPGVYDIQNIEYCRKNNILIGASSPLSRRPQVLFKHPYIVQLCRKYNKKPSQIVLNWGIQQGFIVCPKSSKSDYLEENINIFDFDLTRQQVQKIVNLNIKIQKVLSPETIKY